MCGIRLRHRLSGASVSEGELLRAPDADIGFLRRNPDILAEAGVEFFDDLTVFLLARPDDDFRSCPFTRLLRVGT
jgi:hypothetical protein